MCIFLPLIIFLPLAEVLADMKAHFIDVGYGNCCLIEILSPEETNINILVDCGEKKYSKTIIKYLKNNEIKKIDFIFISHPHDNHYGSLEKITREFGVKQIYWNDDSRPSGIEEEKFLKLRQKLEHRGFNFKTAARGDTIEISKDARIEILHPGEISGSPNDSSLVLKVNYRNISLLIFSDIGPQAQAEIGRIFSNGSVGKLDAQIASWPHHGDIFINDLFSRLRSLKFLIIQTGPNPYNIYPDTDSIKSEAVILRNDRHGNIILESDGNDVWQKK